MRSVELHLFADASVKAYGSVAFLLLQQQTSLVMAKTRVAPLKHCTLPRLELMAALVAARLAKFIISSLNLQGASPYIWTDSQIVLYWIRSSKKLPQFVSHRVAEINQSIPSASWNYCPTNDNPAHLLTRGLTFEQLKSSSLWVHGPTWLHGSLTNRIGRCGNIHLYLTFTLWQPYQINSLPVNRHFTIPTLSRLYSTICKLLTVTAYVYRFVFNLCNQQVTRKDHITAYELHYIRKQWIKDCQHETYWHEIQSLNNPTTNQTFVVSKAIETLPRQGWAYPLWREDTQRTAE